jgi:hypothetical protein
MKKLIRILLTIVAYTPVKSLAHVAHSRISMIDAELQQVKLRNHLKFARQRLVPPGQYGTTISKALARYSMLTGLQGDALQENVIADLEMLRKEGIIRYTDDLIMAASPSEHGPL